MKQESKIGQVSIQTDFCSKLVSKLKTGTEKLGICSARLWQSTFGNTSRTVRQGNHLPIYTNLVSLYKSWQDSEKV